VLRHIRAQLTRLPLLYVADSGHVPYGDKTPDYIRERSLALTEFLLHEGAATVVVACNTATAAAAATLRERFEIPIIAMEPAVKPAVTATRSGVVGVLATVGTLDSARFAALLEQYAGEVEIVTQACPGLVEQVEAGELTSAKTRELVQRYTLPLLERGADTIVLGCTHFPFLRPLIAAAAGPDVQLIDTGEAVARQVVRRLPEKLLGRLDAMPYERFWTTGDARSAERIVSQLWGRPAAVEAL
jgi:glutamate racemase